MNILVIDGEIVIAPLFQQKFRKEIKAGEVSLAFAHSGEEALSYLIGHHSKEMLILSDINMPGMSGIELLKQIRTSYPMAPPTVMMITAYCDEQSYRQAMQYGADDF